MSLLNAAIFLIFILTTNALNESSHNIKFASNDYGGMIHNIPKKVLYPKLPYDISSLITQLMMREKHIKVAARGNGHSIQGQSQALGGIVVNMRSLAGPTMLFNITSNPAYVDVLGGELWINILNESIKYGLTPVSWVDYLYLTVGGTLSNAGISGQAFKYGPQIDNVLQLEIVTGKGEIKVVSERHENLLFNAVLGGLGQFGIITKARIVLAPAPTRVKWIRALYSDFATMSKDQEYLISAIDTFDYIEGFIVIKDANKSHHVTDWGSSYLTKDPLQTSQFDLNKNIQYSIEVAKYYSPHDAGSITQKISNFLSKLSFIKSSLNISDVTYLQFLDRVHITELELRKLGLWEIPHPWLNLLIPKSNIHKFVGEVFGKIITKPVNGPILIYPFNKSRWKNATSFVTPNENINYIVSILSAAVPSKKGELKRLLAQNKIILKFCKKAKLGVKEYLPHYTTYEEWKGHYGRKWKKFVKNKRAYDPLTLLSPGQLIFLNGTTV